MRYCGQFDQYAMSEEPCVVERSLFRQVPAAAAAVTVSASAIVRILFVVSEEDEDMCSVVVTAIALDLCHANQHSHCNPLRIAGGIENRTARSGMD